jgi:hypothetical protein
MGTVNARTIRHCILELSPNKETKKKMLEALTIVHVVEPFLLVGGAGAQLRGLVTVLPRYSQTAQVVGTWCIGTVQ